MAPEFHRWPHVARYSCAEESSSRVGTSCQESSGDNGLKHHGCFDTKAVCQKNTKEPKMISEVVWKHYLSGQLKINSCRRNKPLETLVVLEVNIVIGFYKLKSGPDSVSPVSPD